MAFADRLLLNKTRPGPEEDLRVEKRPPGDQQATRRSCAATKSEVSVDQVLNIGAFESQMRPCREGSVRDGVVPRTGAHDLRGALHGAVGPERSEDLQAHLHRQEPRP